MHRHPNETALLADFHARALFAEVEHERLAIEAERGNSDRTETTGWRRRLAALAATVVGWLEPSGPPVHRDAASQPARAAALRAAAAAGAGRRGRW